MFSVTKDDLDITYFSGTGAGGQHRNRHMNCVCIKHKDTGIMYTGQSSRERGANLKEAFIALAKDRRFRAYCQMRLVETERKETVTERVEKMIMPENLKVETRETGKWQIV